MSIPQNRAVQNAIIAYCPDPTADQPTVDLYRVVGPHPWELQGPLRDTAVGQAGYSLPELDGITTAQQSSTPLHIEDDVPLSEFGNFIDYIAIREVYLVLPTGVYSFVATPIAVNCCEMFEKAGTLSVFEGNPRKTEPEYTLDGDQLSDIVEGRDPFKSATLIQSQYIELGHFAYRNGYDAADMSIHEFEFPDRTILIDYTNLDIFSKLKESGFLLLVNAPKVEMEDFETNATAVKAEVGACRMRAAGQFYRYMSSAVDLEPPEDEHRFTEFDPEIRKYKLCVGDFQTGVYETFPEIVSPLSAYPYGERFASITDEATLTHITLTQSLEQATTA